MNISEILNVYANILAGVIFICSALFAIFYFAFFHIKTTIGRGVRDAISGMALIFWVIFTSDYVHGHGDPFELPQGDPWWHPVQRAIIYTIVSYWFIRLMYIVVLRRFWPDKLTHAQGADEQTLQLIPRKSRAKK